jgi:folate-binding protein YgfZ
MGDPNSRAEELRILAEGAGWLPLAGGCLVRIAGAKRREVLQGVVSQDVASLAEGQGTLALLLAPKGQFQAIMAVFEGGDETHVLTPPGRAEELAGRLSRYLMLSRCTAEPLVDGAALAVLGTRFQEAAAATGADAIALADGGWHDAGVVQWFGRTFLGIPGAVAVARDPAVVRELGQHLLAAGTNRVSEQAAELARIRVGWPAWGAELTESVLPPEAGIAGETISSTKGCYVGQETIARLQTYGHPNRGLVGLRQKTGGDDAPELPLSLSREGEEKVRGALTSWGRHPEIGGVGLALVRRELTEPGTALAGSDRTFEVAPFPLW